VPPRLVVSGQSPAGARLAARIGDAWTCPEDVLDRLLPVHREAVQRAGRDEARPAVVVGVAPEMVLQDPARAVGDLAERGADEVVVEWVRRSQLDPLLEALSAAG
jgi:alkanesulfonate monooxygenase SsuD/methylene tetrahydromethanopterin reductase-like flavin-dependent oxidoreductase (luciferase family)